MYIGVGARGKPGHWEAEGGGKRPRTKAAGNAPVVVGSG